MAEYRYNVIIEIGVDPTNFQQGKEQAKAQLRAWEEEVTSSQRRMDRTRNEMKDAEIKRYTERMNAQKAYSARVKAEEDSLFNYQMKKRDEFFANTQKMFSDSGAFDNWNRHTKKAAQEYGAMVDQVLGRTKELETITGKSLLGDKNTPQRNAELKARQEELRAIKILEAENYRERLLLHESFVNSLARQANTASGMAQGRNGLAGQGTVTGAFNPSNINGNAIPMPNIPLLGITDNLAARISSNKELLIRTFASNQLNDAARNIQNITGQNILLDKALTNNTKTLSMWGQAFKGAFVGAVAGMTFSTVISGITSMVEKVVDFVKTSVEMAGKLEQTTNALTVFTGSAEIARQELAQLDEVARTTTGLSLPSARDGYQQLRALNFEADLSRKLIAGIGKERLLSGADEQSVQRVVTNLVQLSAGSSRASQDVKEMIHAIPRLGLEFQKAYGTLNFKEIGQMFKTDPQGALKKLAEAMNEAKGASGGFLDAQMKLGDEIQRVQEKAGQPLMKALTADIIYLTSAIHDNESMFIRWGIQIENTYAGLKQLANLIGNGFTAIEPTSVIANAIGLNSDSMLGKLVFNKGILTIAETLGENRRPRIIEQDSLGDVVQTALVNAKLAEQRKKEKDEASRLAMAKGNYATTQAQTKDAYRVAQAGLDSTVRNTPQDEIAYIKATSQLKENQFSMEYQKAKEHYNVMWELNKKNDEELYKLNEEFLKETSKYNADRLENEYKTAKQIAEIEKQIANERRQNNIEFIKLQGQAVQQGYEQRTIEIERYLTTTDKLEQDSFSQLRELTIGTYDSLIEKNRDTLQIQLMDKTLSVEKIRNLQKQSELEEIKLENEKANKLYEINEKFIQRKLQLLEDGLQKQIRMINNRQNELDNAGGLLSLDMFSQDSFNTFQANTFGGNPNQIPKAFTDKIEELKNKYADTTDLRQAKFNLFRSSDQTLPSTQALKKEIDALDLASQKYANNLAITIASQETWTKSVTQNQLEINKLAESILNGSASLDVFDKIAEKIAEGKYFNEIAKLQAESKKLDESLKTKSDPAIFKQQAEIDSQISKLMSDRDLEILKAKRESVAGLNDEIAKLMSNDLITIFNLTAGINSNLTGEYRDAVKEGKQAEIILRNENLQTIYREIKAQQVQNQLYQQELDAITLKDKSRMLIAEQYVYHKNQADAKVLEYVASQKGLTDIISDAKINLMTDAFSALDNVIQRMTQSFGFASDAVNQFLSGLIKLGLNKLFLKLFGIDLNGGSKGGFGATADGGGFGGGGGAGGNGGLADVLTTALHGRGASGSATDHLSMLHGLGGMQLGANGMPTTGSIFTNASGEQQMSVNASGELLGAGSSVASSSKGLASLSSGSLGGLGAMLPFLGGALGSKLGGSSMTGRILGALGGVAGGIAGLGLTGGLTGLLGIGGALTATAIALPLAPILLVGAYLLSRNAKRRQEETQRDKAMVDAFAKMDKLISDVQSDKVDGVSALTQADQIRQSYLDEMGKLKDDKTRRIALADVSRIDAKISLLKSAVSAQQRRQERLTQLVPTFADGGNVSSFIGSNYANNPLGYQTGRNRVGWFNEAQTFAKYNELGNEYIFDHQTTQNIGVRDLDMIRATKGASYLAMKQRFTPKAMMSGGEINNVPNISNFAPSSASGNSSSGNGKTELHANFQIGLAESTFIEVLSAYIANEGGQEMLDVIANITQNQGGNNKLTQAIVDSLRQKGILK